MDWYEAAVEFDGRARAGLHFRDAQHGERRSVSRWPTITPRSRHFWKRTSWRFAISAGCSGGLRYDNLKSAVKKILRGLPAGRDRTA